MSRLNWSNPFTIAALGIAAGGLLWGIAQLLPAIAAFFAIIIKAIGAAGGLAIAVSSTGFATAGVFAAWLPNVATLGVATAGMGTTYLVVAKIVEKGKEKPYEWLLPALGLLAVFFVDLTKDQLVPTGTERALYGLTTALLTIGGGFLLLQKKLIVRAIGFILPFIPACVVCLLLIQENHVSAALSDFIASGSVGAIGLIGVFVLGALIAILGVVIPSNNEE
ncbi:hypothetical protein [Aquitalea sp. USM4]|uniref:hypothetical protein n=1 Tax=Aquitalea sp. USM4 TaxID=1590041 RepID=UPI00103EE0E9|nr:hypothetical protein [Aquitalea sp. USM4]QBJ77879.1 hypothetical protein DKK66_07050 [Aquitalea sp. USM4]